MHELSKCGMKLMQKLMHVEIEKKRTKNDMISHVFIKRDVNVHFNGKIFNLFIKCYVKIKCIQMYAYIKVSSSH